MSSLDNHIANRKVRLDQLKQQKREQIARENERLRKLENRRRYIVGEKVIQYFPEVLLFTSQQSAEDRANQIALLDNLLRTLAKNPAFIQLLTVEASHHERQESLVE